MGNVQEASLGHPTKTSIATQVAMGKRLLAMLTSQTNPPKELFLENDKYRAKMEIVERGRSLCVFIDVDPKVLSKVN